jgi:hypothetical protein
MNTTVHDLPTFTETPSATTVRPPAASGIEPSLYMVSPWYDWLFFLSPPVVALFLGILVSHTYFTTKAFLISGQSFTWERLMIGMFIHAHLFAVVFRSHGNPQIFRKYRIRFVVVPIVLFISMLLSNWVLVSISVLATFWDVYHSGLQTFGFARIYDKKAGNDPKQGRTLDMILNHLLYAGPIVSGATMLAHFSDFNTFRFVNSTFFPKIPLFMVRTQRYFAWSIVTVGGLFLIYYVYAYWQLSKKGYQISPLKVFLLVSTAAVSIYSWGFDTWAEAFFIMNFFHAFQYFGIVWCMEKKQIMKRFRLQNRRGGMWISLFLLVAITFAYGFAVQAIPSSVIAFYSFSLVVSIMHFWYDGFIWSVSRKEV